MQELLENPWLLLEGRIAYRKFWAMSGASQKPKVDKRALAVEIEYDEAHNFARVGREFVDDDFGKHLPRKAYKPRRSIISSAREIAA